MNHKTTFEPKNILCAMDFSELSNLALKYAAVGAREYSARLTVLHAEAFELPRYFSGRETERLVKELAAAKKAVRTDLAEHVKRILGSTARGLAIEYAVLEIHPIEAVLSTAENESMDLIVMGTQGSSGLKRLLLGSVTEAVVGHAKIPVFTVRQNENQFIDVTNTDAVPRIDRILCPCNLSKVATVALRHAVSLAERFHAGLTILYSLESDDPVDESRSRQELCEWIDKTVKTQCTMDPVVRKGHAAEQILTHAKEKKVDLIVLSAQHHQFRQTTFFGKTTDLVIRHATSPVLVAPQFL